MPELPPPASTPVRLIGGPYDGAPVRVEPGDRDVYGALPHDLATVAHWGHDYYLSSVDATAVPPLHTYAYRYPRTGIRHVCRQPDGCTAGCPNSPARRARATGTTVPCPACNAPTIVTTLADPYGRDTTRGITVRLDAAPSDQGTVRFYGTYGVALPPPTAQAERDAGARLYAVHTISCGRVVSGDA